MKKIGILFGQEDTFPWALLERINSKKVTGITGEPVRIDKLVQGEPSGYAVIIAGLRMSLIPRLPEERRYEGTESSTPLWWSADEKSSHLPGLKVGVACPDRAAASKENPPDTGDTSSATWPTMDGRNFDYVGWPPTSTSRRRLEERLPAGNPTSSSASTMRRALVMMIQNRSSSPVLPLLRLDCGRGHMQYDPRQPFTRGTCASPAGLRGASGLEGEVLKLNKLWATTSTPSSRGARRVP